MHFKICLFFLVLLFLLKGKDAKLLKTFDNRADHIQDGDDDEVMMKDEETKRSLYSKDTEKDFREISLELAKVYLLEETMKKKKAITSLQNEVNSPDKCKKIAKVGDPIVHHHSGSTYGAWMKDPLGLLGPEKIWYINSYTGNKVLEFDSMNHFKGGEVAKTYTLPYKFDGTGHVVYGRYLYYNRVNTNKIVQYDLVKRTVVRQAAPDSRINPRQYRYSWGGDTTMDLSADESGLWVLYSTSSHSGKLCATQLDPLTLKSLQIFCPVSSESMPGMGNAFVACGVVYCIDSFRGPTTTINYAYDTATKNGTNPGINFVNKYNYNSMVTYNPHEKVLYAWDNHRQITYPLEFED